MAKQKKISVSDYGALAAMAANKDAERVILGKVGGIVTGTAESTTVKGDTLVGLRGAFRFVPVTGESATAPVLWLPGDHDDNIKARLAASGDGAEIKFLYEVAAVKQAAAPGFAYEVLPLLDIEVYEAPKIDPLASMFDAPAPKEPDAPDAEAAKPVDKAHKPK